MFLNWQGRKQVMERFLTFFLISSVSSIWWQSLPSLLMIALVGIAALLFLKFERLFSFTRPPLFTQLFTFMFGRAEKGLLCAIGAWAGVLWVASLGHWDTYLQQPFNDYQQTVTVVGTVKSLHLSESRQKVLLQTERVAATQFRWQQPLIRLSWYHPELALKQGQQVQLQVKLKPIHGLANQHGFHFQQWLFANGIVATGYIKSSPVNQILTDRVTLRQQLAQTITQMELTHPAWLLALALGYRDGLTGEDWTILQQTGTAHLVAISGLHVGMVASVVLVSMATLASALALLLKLFKTRGVVNNGTIKKRLLPALLFTPWRFALLSTFFIAVIYSWLAGFSTPTVRAIIMLGLLTIVALNRFYWRPKRLLLVCAAASVLLMPGAIYTASFWLSFGAVAIIFFWLWLNPGFASPTTEDSQPGESAPMARRTPIAGSMFGKVIVLQFTLSLLMTPLVMWQMNTVSTVSPLANLIAVPLVSFVILPASLLGVFALALHALGLPIDTLIDVSVCLLQFADTAFGLLIEILAFMSTWHWQAEWLNFLLFLNGWQWFGLIVAFILLCLPSSPLPRHLALFGVLPALSTLFNQDKAWYVNVLDVGQGTAVLIERQNKAMLIDTGAAFPSGFTMADAVILPYLRGQHIPKLDWLLISHSDNDHAGGLPVLNHAIQIDGIATNEDGCVAGNRWQWQGLTVEVLWPFSDNKTESAKGGRKAQRSLNSDNNRSCVIRVSDANYSVLLPGDIELPAEKALLSYYQNIEGSTAEKLQADLLVAPHHGSKTSSSMAFIETVNPQTVVFSQGFRNRWQLPHKAVLHRYEQLKNKSKENDQATALQLFETATSGQIKIRINEQSVEIKTFRQHIYPYWYAN